MYCDERSQYIRVNSKKDNFRGNYSRIYGIFLSKLNTKVLISISFSTWVAH